MTGDREKLTREINDRIPGNNQKLLIWWLGQSGFLIKSRNTAFVIDPYLSTALEEATKDMGPEIRHIRMMPVPVIPEQIRCLDYIFCTHDHGDHYDPESVRLLKKGNPSAKIVVPLALRPSLIRDGFPEEDIIIAGTEMVCQCGKLEVKAIAGKHNEFDYSKACGFPYVGFVIRVEGVCIYHSGDTILYEGLSEALRKEAIDLGMMAINGYDDERIRAGFQSNCTYREAAGLAKGAGIKWMVPCHYGMFTANTEQVEKYVNYMNENPGMPDYLLPVIGEPLIIKEDRI